VTWHNALPTDMLQIAPSALSEFLQKNGYTRVGGRTNLYDRFKLVSGNTDVRWLPWSRPRFPAVMPRAPLLRSVPWPGRRPAPGPCSG
jgi:hypothetical protein